MGNMSCAGYIPEKVRPFGGEVGRLWFGLVQLGNFEKPPLGGCLAIDGAWSRPRQG